jgi:hypothetical protein
MNRFLPLAAAAFLLVAAVDAWSGVAAPPYGLLVDCLAVFYGWKAGMVAALTGAVAQTVVSEGASWQGLLQMVLRAMLFGLLSDTLRRRSGSFRREIVTQASEVVRLGERCAVLEQANGRLQGEVERLSQEREPLHRISARLVDLTTTQQIHEELVRACAEGLGAQRCSYFDCSAGQPRLAAAFGWPAGSAPSPDALLRLAMEQKAPQSLRDLPLSSLERAEGLRMLAAPVLHPEGGQVLGVLCVDQLPFERFTAAAVSLLEAVATLAGRLLAQAGSATVPETGEWHDWLSTAEITRRLRRLVAARHNGAAAPFCLLTLQIEAGNPEAVGLCERALYLLGRANLRPADAGGRSGPGVIAFVLENCRLEEIRGLIQPLARQVNRFLPRWVPELGQASVLLGIESGEGAGSGEELLQSALKGGQPCHLLI